MKNRRDFLVLLGAGALSSARLVFAQPRMARVGWMMTQAYSPYGEMTARGFIKGLAEHGYVEGKNLVLERRSS